MKEQEKASEFIERYTKELNGKKYIDAVEALIEMYARLMSAQNEIRNIHEALGDYGKFSMDIDKRVSKLEGNKKIEIISPEQAKILLK